MAETGGRYYPSAQPDKIEVMQAASVTELLSEMPGHVTLSGIIHLPGRYFTPGKQPSPSKRRLSA
jgi:hypothetical protein